MDVLAQARKGDAEAFKMLFEQYQPVVLRMAKKYQIHMFTTDDWLQEGQIIFFRALNYYQPDGGASLGTLFRIMFENHVRSMLRRQNALKRRGDQLSDSVEQTLEEEGVDLFELIKEPHPTPLDYVLLREKFYVESELFSQFELAVILAYIRGEELVMIAEKLAISIESAQNALDRGRRKVAKYIR